MNKADVVVVGGGIIGTSVAYYLTRYGLDIILVEKEDLAAGSSGSCDGFVFLQSKKPGIYLRVALESAKLYQNLTEELGYDIEYQKCGGMVLIETEEQQEFMANLVERQKEAGVEISYLSGDQARDLEPTLSQHLMGATFSSLDAQVNPLRVGIGFATAARRKGARLFLHTEVSSIKTKKLGGELRLESVITDKGEIETDKVVNAAGVFAPRVADMVGFKLPIKPRRGQILVTEPLPKVVNRIFVDAKYIAVKLERHNSQSCRDELDAGLTLEQAASGNLLVGSTREFVGYDRRTTYQGITTIARNMMRLVPGLKSANVIRTFAGLRPHTPDGLPLLGGVEGISGFFIAAGHEGDGVALAPITGKLIAELIAEGRSSISLDKFNPQRFQKSK